MFKAINRIPYKRKGDDSYVPIEVIQKEKCYFGNFAIKQIEERIENAYNKIECKNHPTASSDSSLSEESKSNSKNEGSSDQNTIINKFKRVIDYQIKHIVDLMLQKRNDLPVLNNRTNAELLGFSRKTNFTGAKRTRPTRGTEEDKFELEYIEDSIEDLYKYRDGIITNFKKLRSSIESKYQEYFNEV